MARHWKQINQSSTHVTTLKQSGAAGSEYCVDAGTGSAGIIRFRVNNSEFGKFSSTTTEFVQQASSSTNIVQQAAGENRLYHDGTYGYSVLQYKNNHVFDLITKSADSAASINLFTIGVSGNGDESASFLCQLAVTSRITSVNNFRQFYHFIAEKVAGGSWTFTTLNNIGATAGAGSTSISSSTNSTTSFVLSYTGNGTNAAYLSAAVQVQGSITAGSGSSSSLITYTRHFVNS
jgi:hypothetical protein